MKLKVRFAKAAERDLEAIGDWIAEDSPSRAHSFVRELRASCDGLAEMPYRFQRVEKFPGLRRRVHGNYLIFYRVKNEHVELIHILHGAVDMDNIPGLEN